MTAVRRFLTRLEKQTAVRALIFAGLLVLIAATMFALNAHTPLQMDDYDYSISWATGKPVSGLADVIASQAAHYRLWGGRSVVHALAQMFLYMGKGVFNIANTVMYLLLLLEIYALSKPKGKRFCWALLLAEHAFLFFGVSFFGTVFLWLDGACNYLWGTVLALLPLCLVPRASEKTDALSVLSIPACFLAGWTNENTACGVLAATLLLLGYRKFRKEPIGVCAYLCVLAQACGAAVMILAPGNFARASSYVYDSMVVEIAVRLARITLYTVVYAGVLLAALMLVHALGRAMNVNMRTMRALWFAAAALLCAYAMAASPELSDRSFTGVLALLMVGVLTLLGDIDAQSDMFDAAKLAVLPIAALLLAYGGVQAVREVAVQEAAWGKQIAEITETAEAGGESVSVQSVQSHSRFTMDITLDKDAENWPNSTLQKIYGVRVYGE